MVEKFGNLNLYDKYDMSDYELKRDPMVFKYDRSEFEKICPSNMDFIKDQDCDYVHPQPKSLANLVDNKTVFTQNHKRKG